MEGADVLRQAFCSGLETDDMVETKRDAAVDGVIEAVRERIGFSGVAGEGLLLFYREGAVRDLMEERRI